MEKFSLSLHRTPAPTPAEEWGERLFEVLRALRDSAGIERVLHWESPAEREELEIDPGALAGFLRLRPASRDEAGVPQPRAGVNVILAGLTAGDPDDESLCEISLGTGELGPPPNVCRINFWRELPPDNMPALFNACVRGYSPDWAALETTINVDQRLDEETDQLEPGAPMRPVDTWLHWRTYFDGPHASRLPLDSLEGRDDVTVRPLHGGVELALGQRWESNDALRARQRALEPLLFGEYAAN
jgi:hypothetical protein